MAKTQPTQSPTKTREEKHTEQDIQTVKRVKRKLERISNQEQIPKFPNN